MPTISISVPHRQPKEEAIKKIKGLLAEVKVKHQDDIDELHEHWEELDCGSFSFKIHGMSVEGVLQVKDREVVLKGNIPLLAVPFKGRITEVVIEQANKLLA